MIHNLLDSRVRGSDTVCTMERLRPPPGVLKTPDSVIARLRLWRGRGDLSYALVAHTRSVWIYMGSE